jgi:hypothetical protein
MLVLAGGALYAWRQIHAVRGLAIGLALTVFVAASPLGYAPPRQASSSRPILRVLFIGNSYTYFNNLGDIVAGIAAVDPDGPAIVPALAAHGGATLKWHLENGSAVQQLQTGGWNYVVLQEQSLLGGSVVDGKTVVGAPVEFYASVREWVRRIRATGATPILYMTWARREPADAVRVQKELAEAYQRIGHELQVRVAPVGLAWAEARRRLRTIDLHIWDGSHPTPIGSYLAALVMYSTLTGRSALGAPALIYGHPTIDLADASVVDASVRVPLADVRDATARALQDIAAITVSENN